MNTEYTRPDAATSDRDETRSAIPDLTAVTEQLLLIGDQLTNRPSAWNTSSDEILVKTNAKEREMPERITGAGQPLLLSLRIALAQIEKRQGLTVTIPAGGALCEIGGPTYGTSVKDLFYSKATRAVYANPSKKMVAGGYTLTKMEDTYRALCSLELAIHEEDTPVERLDELKRKYGAFDYITAYAVFGSENVQTVSWDPDTGVDLETSEKRKHVLKGISGALKINGLLLIELNTPGEKNPNNRGKEWGLTDAEAERFPSKKGTNMFGDPIVEPEPGFTREELEDAGFRIITKRPLFGNCYVFQYRGQAPSDW